MPTVGHISYHTAANPGHMTDRGTNQYLLGNEEITVIDVALSSDENIDAILETVEARGGRKIEKILLTHIHRDHSGGVLALKKRSGAKIGISRFRAGYLGGEDFTYGDGETLAYDGGELTVIHTPGHESGHCCFYEPKEQVLFTGDHILGRGTTVIPVPDGDMELYIRSLEKLLSLKLRLLLPGHGPRIDDPYGKIKEYIKHRLDREQEVLHALRDGRQTIGSITMCIYTDIPPALIPIAQLTVEAHLIKLIKEGRAEQRGQDYFERPGA